MATYLNCRSLSLRWWSWETQRSRQPFNLQIPAPSICKIQLLVGVRFDWWKTIDSSKNDTNLAPLSSKIVLIFISYIFKILLAHCFRVSDCLRHPLPISPSWVDDRFYHFCSHLAVSLSTWLWPLSFSVHACGNHCSPWHALKALSRHGEPFLPCLWLRFSPSPACLKQLDLLCKTIGFNICEHLILLCVTIDDNVEQYGVVCVE